YLDKDELLPWLENAKGIDAIIHMGAISATTERDFNKLVADNIRYSQLLWDWCAKHGVSYLYASSAATYGDGAQGYSDEESLTDTYRPLNGYGYSKQFFDQWVLRQVKEGKPVPPQWCGFKFFNVYGPNNTIRVAWRAWHFIVSTNSKNSVLSNSLKVIVQIMKTGCNCGTLSTSKMQQRWLHTSFRMYNSQVSIMSVPAKLGHSKTWH